ncbi:MAG: glycosyltransferase family 1 protein [Acidobacteria bacterium]|nr:glycosyltransferase family 1 protein [Acidobacteriota bacterium]
MENENIILFSSDDWGWKTSKYQLAIRFSRKNRVLFVSSIGFRAPTVSRQDMGRILRKLKSFLKGIEKVDENLYVLTPLVIPFQKNRFIKRVNLFLLRTQLRWARVRLKMQNPFVFVFSQNWYELIKKMPRKKLINYCVDEHSGFNIANPESFRKLNQLMCQVSDIVFCSSNLLTEAYRKFNPNTCHISHGVDYALFSRAVFDTSLETAPEAAGLNAPVLGFWGHISYEWVDAGLLKYLAEKQPSWTILLIGRNSMLPDEFSNYGNIVLAGEKDFEALPSFCKKIDVALIPFVRSTLTDNCNPLKLYEYLAAGLPVVSTDIPEVRFHGKHVLIAEGREEFLKRCEEALDLNCEERKREVSLSMKENTWDHKVELIYRIIEGDCADQN